MQVRDLFETLYSARETYWRRHTYSFSTSPDDLAPSLLGQAALRFARSRGPGYAIDIGSGEGTDAVRLARLGWRVEAVELTSAGCGKISATARAMDVNIGIHQADIRTFTTDRKFDLVLCNGVLHYLAEKRVVCRKLQAMTSVRGANILSLWSDYTPVPECHRVVPVYPDAEHGVVVDAYDEWEKQLLYFERSKPESGHNDMPPHSHSHIKMVAVRGK